MGVGQDHKPFECVGDPDESAVALERVTQLREWRTEDALAAIARQASPDRDLGELLETQGPSRAAAHWLR